MCDRHENFTSFASLVSNTLKKDAWLQQLIVQQRQPVLHHRGTKRQKALSIKINRHGAGKVTGHMKGNIADSSYILEGMRYNRRTFFD
jgi:hypothetical protein